MDINALSNDEFLVECDVRNLHGTAVESYKLLKQQLELERTTPVLVPNRAHPAARKNPKREVAKCVSKLRSIRVSIQELASPVAPEKLTQLTSKLLHVNGRISRLSASKTVKPDLPEVQAIINCLEATLTKLKKAKLTDADEYSLNRTLEALHLDGESEINSDSDSDAPPKHPKPSSKPDSDPNLTASDTKPATSQTTSVTYNPALQKSVHFSTDTGVDEQRIQQLANTIRERWDKLGTPLEATGSTLSNPTSFNTSATNLCSGHSHLPIPENRASANPGASTWSQIPISNARDFSGSYSSSRPLYRWNLRFDGSSADKTDIERFLYRVERTALKYQVSQISLVEELGSLLTGEALEWYWLFLERHGAVTWAQLRSELVRRFQRPLTEEDIWQELDNRKQRLPKESFYDFYSAMFKIAMKSPSIIPEDSLLRYLKKNMRPGLQLHLQMSEKSVKSVNQLIAICVHWEQTWNRNGYCPEAFLQTPGAVPKKFVHELDQLSYPTTSDSTDSVPYLAAYKHVQPDTRDISLNNKNVTFKDAPNIPPSASDTRRLPPTNSQNKLVICWNCKDLGHTYPDCTIPPTHIFCYGCGIENTIKPRCVNCNPTLAGNSRMEMRWSGRAHSPRQLNQSSTSPRPRSPSEREPTTILKR